MNIMTLRNTGVVADYVMIMCYDEHTDNSYEAGSVASINYVESGITDALKSVPASKIGRRASILYQAVVRDAEDRRRTGGGGGNRSRFISQ